MKLIRSHILTVKLLLAIVAAACDRQSAAPPTTAPATPQLPKLTTVPVEVTVKQRSTTAVPGSDGRLLLTVDDVTRDQVMVSLAAATDGAAEALLPTRSMSPRDAARFAFGGVAYELTLKGLENALAGEDSATFVIATASTATTTATTATTAASLTEKAKIERLIQAIADLE